MLLRHKDRPAAAAGAAGTQAAEAAADMPHRLGDAESPSFWDQLIILLDVKRLVPASSLCQDPHSAGICNTAVMGL